MNAAIFVPPENEIAGAPGSDLGKSIEQIPSS
jgi:hypothetical protein